VLATWNIRSENRRRVPTKSRTSSLLRNEYASNQAERKHLCLIRERKTGQGDKSTHVPCCGHLSILSRLLFSPSAWCRRLPWFMLLFDSHDAIHPTPEPLQPGSAASMEEQHALARLESAAQALDAVVSD
jgi:hypothetical protein